MESPTPGEAVARLFITGERGAGQDWDQQLLEAVQSQQPQVQDLQPTQSPVRGAGIGLPGQPGSGYGGGGAI